MKPIEQKDTGTATDIPASLEATDEQVARFRMDDTSSTSCCTSLSLAR